MYRCLRVKTLLEYILSIVLFPNPMYVIMYIRGDLYIKIRL